MKIAIITDAWHPQVNGVVRTLSAVIAEMRSRGHTVEVISPDLFRTVPAPSYPEIRLALAGWRSIAKRLENMQPDTIHIATEGPLGWAARRYCLRADLPFTTAYHTQFPDYMARRCGIPASWFWPVIRHFHAPASRTMVSTETIAAQLRQQGIGPLHHWSRGVATDVFHPDQPPPDLFFHLPRPIQLYVGRVAVEKNIEAFLSSTHGGTKVVVGDGPALERLRTEFPEARFLGKREGNELGSCFAGADVFVFPSTTDTFGLVMIEALSCGTPVAAFPVPGPLDVLAAGGGVMADKLDDAIAGALKLDRDSCHRLGSAFTWEASADQFLAGLAPIMHGTGQAELSRHAVTG